MPERRRRAARRRLLIRRIIGRRLRARWIWAGRILVLAFVLLAVAWIVLTRSPLTRRLALGPLSQQFGVELQADAVYVDLGGVLVMERVRAIMPGIPGLPGRFLEVDRLEADVAWIPTLRGTPTVRRINLPANALVRVSQSVHDATLNIDPLVASKPSSSTRTLPTIIAHSAVLEMGEHDGADYTPLKRLTVEGALQPNPRGGYQVSMRQLGAIGPGSASSNRLAALDGVITTDLTSFVVQNIELADWPPESVPSQNRWMLENLHLSGEISRTTLTYAPASGVIAKIDLAGVALDLPVPPEPGMRAQGPMRLSDVNGTITFSRAGLKADLAGLLGDLPYSVRLEYRGLDLVSPFICRFECKDFPLETNPALLPYAPQVVRDRLANFSSPTARVSASVVVSRGAPSEGVAAEPRIDGLIEFEEGTAAFHKFPYRFENMSGIVEFDDRRIRILEITGEAPSGATLVARGRIEPPDEHALVEIDVDVQHVPIDSTLGEALGPGRGDIVPALFDDAARDRLRAADLLDPGFELGGEGSIRVRVVREHGTESVWRYRVDAEFPKVGLVPEKFPFPVAARDVRLEIEDDVARIASGEFRPLGGGSASVEGGVGIVRGPDGTPSLRPELEVHAQHVPIDRRLAFAIAGSANRPGFDEELLAVGLAGELEARVTISPREDGELGYELSARSSDATFTRDGISGDAVIELAGDEHRLNLRADGSLHANGLDACPEFSASATVAPDRRALDVRLASLDLSTPVEAIVRRWAPEAADRAAEARRDHSPSGRADLALSVEWNDAGQARPRARASNLRGVEFDAGLWRHRLENPAGSIELRGDEGSVVFESIEADLVSTLLDPRGPIAQELLAVPIGRLRVDGRWPLQGATATSELDVVVSNGRIESPLVLAAVRGAAPAAALFLEDRLASGVFDARTRITASPDGSPTFRGEVHPRSFAFVSAGARLHAELSGSIAFDSSSATIEDLRAVGDGWSLNAGGQWRASADGWSLESSFDADADALTPALRELLPSDAQAAISAVRLELHGPISLGGARLVLTQGESSERAELDARLRFANASLDPGLPIARAVGEAQLRYRRQGDTPPSAELEVDCSTVLAMNIGMTGVRTRVKSGPSPGDIVIPVIEGDCHGGRVSAKAEVRAPIAPGGRREFFVDARVSGVRLAPLLSELSSQFDDTPSDPPDTPDEDSSRGEVDGELALGGVVGDDAERRGRGTFTISQGRVLRMPLVVPLLEVTNLQLPRNERLDYAQAAFYIEPGRIVFEDLSIFSRALAVFGWGEVAWPSLELDLEFESRSARPIPILSAILQGIRSQLVTTAVRGTVRDPQVRLRQASGQFIERAMGVPGPGRPARWTEDQSRHRRDRASGNRE